MTKLVLMKKPPKNIDNAEVISFVFVYDRKQDSEKVRHFIDGELQSDFFGLAVCQYKGEKSYYLFYCDESWETITDTLHRSFDEAIKFAEQQYENVNLNWQNL